VGVPAGKRGRKSPHTCAASARWVWQLAQCHKASTVCCQYELVPAEAVHGCFRKRQAYLEHVCSILRLNEGICAAKGAAVGL
jgi:hypothetical protein